MQFEVLDLLASSLESQGNIERAEALRKYRSVEVAKLKLAIKETEDEIPDSERQTNRNDYKYASGYYKIIMPIVDRIGNNALPNTLSRIDLKTCSKVVIGRDQYIIY
jgi:hypothetical protein